MWISSVNWRVGLGDRFWKDARALYDDLLAPAGVTFQEAAKRRRLYAPLRYETYREKGFQTPSGKIELYSSLAKQNGCDPVPRYTPPFESGRPSEQYPLLMSTGRHESAFRISENRQNPYLLELAPRAYLYINPATAEQLGISDGMRVRVQSSAGSAFAYARFTFGMAQGVVQGVSGWWGEYNINKTVPWDGFAQGMGTVCARGYYCSVTPAPEEE